MAILFIKTEKHCQLKGNPETARSSNLKDATILSACIIWKTCLKLIELNPSNQKALRKIIFLMLSGGRWGWGGV